MIFEMIFSWSETSLHVILNSSQQVYNFLFQFISLSIIPATYHPPFCFNLFPSLISLPPLSCFSLSTSHFSSGRHLLVDCYWWYRIAVGFTPPESGANGLSNALLWMQPVKRGEIGSDLIRGWQRQNKMFLKRERRLFFSPRKKKKLHKVYFA